MHSPFHTTRLTSRTRATRERSRSSPSPPPLSRSTPRDAGRTKANGSPSVARRVNQSSAVQPPPMEWSSSYHGGSSSSAASRGESTTSSAESDDVEDEPPQYFRGRSASTSTIRKKAIRPQRTNKEQTPTPRMRTYPRSGSPFTKVRRPEQSMGPRTNLRARPKVSLQSIMLPTSLSLDIVILFASTSVTISIDTRKFGELFLLTASLAYASFQLSQQVTLLTDSLNIKHHGPVLEITALCILTIAYFVVSHCRIAPFGTKVDMVPSPVATADRKIEQGSSPKRPPSSDINKAFLWMSVPKNYRASNDDGLICAIVMPTLIAVCVLYTALVVLAGQKPPLLSGWLIEAPQTLPMSKDTYTSIEALVMARLNLVDLATMCGTTVIMHVSASWWFESRHVPNPEESGERLSVPRGEFRRSWYYISFAFLLTLVLLVIHFVVGAWQNLNSFDILVASLFYQFTLYTALRLAHHGFTLGELALVCFGGTALYMEFLYFTISRMWPLTTTYINTYRLPTPLLVYQLALIAGSFLVGFLLAPFLVLSRHVASRPLRRLRDPRQNQRNKRSLALGFYIGTVLIVVGPIGLWARWCLGGRDPWVWALFFVTKGQRIWTRFGLLGYWGLLTSISVAGWNRQLARSRKSRARNNTSTSTSNASLEYQPPTSTTAATATGSPTFSPSESTMTDGLASGSTIRMSLSALPALPTGAGVSTAANDLLDAADKRVPTLSLNARRKFFHALAVVMFVPGIALDPAFTHLAFSVCFALFIFAEYVRYFALYPFGASVHVFMYDFLDSKDSGTAILSHFFLLSGCAGSLWLESSRPIQNFTGTLVLGVGDAMASIVGKRAGKHRWSSSTFRTLEGSMAFVVSVTTCAWLLKLCGVAGDFELRPYFLVVVLASLLEALSEQNDNLILPLYTWSMLALL